MSAFAETPVVVTQEYIWIDGTEPVPQLRSKTRIVPYLPNGDKPKQWTFDGSSTNQATGKKSDLILNPVRTFPDPIRGALGTLVLCEVLNEDGTPHVSNARHLLSEQMAKYSAQEVWIGFEQEYVLFSRDRPMGWPQIGEPSPQGPYYCAVGGGMVAGREIVEKHTMACISAGIHINGTNAEVMLGQWEFQVGPVNGTGDPLLISDHLWVARWLLHRIAEEYNVSVILDCKPIKGDWNGSGLHTNVSTTEMRAPRGLVAIDLAIEKLRPVHVVHIKAYGHGLEDRLTGKHETCDINTFKSGIGDRTASIRIPLHVAKDERGYLEDRRPGSNADPYKVASAMVRTICG